MRRRRAISLGCSGPYQDIGMSSLPRHGSDSNIILFTRACVRATAAGGFLWSVQGFLLGSGAAAITPDDKRTVAALTTLIDTPMD